MRCLLTPGHTLGHMSYFLWEEECPDPPAVFSGTGCPVPTCPTSPCPIPLSDPPNSPGDALSVAGCGSHLEGTAQQMYQSLVETLGTLPPETVSSLPLALSWLWGPGFPYKQHALHLPTPGFRMTAFLPAMAGSGPARGWGASLPVGVLCTRAPRLSRRYSAVTSTRWATSSSHRKWSLTMTT